MISDENTKDVMIAVTFGKDFLFLPEFLQTLENLDYPKEHICLHITVQNSTKYDFIKSTINSWRPKYQNIKFLPSANAAKAKQDAIHYAKNFRVNYILFLSSLAHLEDPTALKDLIKADKDVVAPFLMTYETFSHARRVCPIGMHKVINDSNSFPHLVTQKGKTL